MIVRRRVYLILLLAVLMAALTWWNFSGKKQETQFILSNGDQLTFLDTTVGPNSTYCYGSTFQRLAARVPFDLGKPFAGNIAMAWSQRSNDLILWFTFTSDTDPSMRLKFLVVDESGFEADPGFELGIVGGFPNETGFLLQNGALPRRSRKFTVRILETLPNQPPQTLGELTIKNPFWKRYPEWTPEPLPKTQKLENAEVTLEDFTLTLGSSWSAPGSPASRQESFAKFNLRVTEAGQPADQWIFLGTRCSNATGDFSPAWTVYPQSVEKFLNLIGPWPLWPNEKVVAIQTLWIRKEVPPPDRNVVFYDVPIPWPRPDAVVLLTTNHPLGQFAISYHHARSLNDMASHISVWSGDARFYDYSQTDVNIYYFHAAQDDRTNRLERIDDRRFRVPDEVTSVDIAIHLPQARRVDFVVSPKLISTNSMLRNGPVKLIPQF